MKLTQMANIEERETYIHMDYMDRKVYVTTNVAVVMNRMDKKKFKVNKEWAVEGQVWSREYVLDFKDMVKVAKMGLFNCGRDGEDELEDAE